MAPRKRVDSAIAPDALYADGHPSHSIRSIATHQQQQLDCAKKTDQAPLDELNRGYKAVVNRMLHRPKQRKITSRSKITKNRSSQPSSLITSTPASDQKPQKQGPHCSTIQKLHPKELLDEMIECGPSWPVSGKLPGQPGYGYMADGTPLGAEYIKYNKDSLASVDVGDAPATFPPIGEPSRALGEIDKAGWGPKEDIAPQVIATSRDGQLNVANTRKYLRKKERAELRRVLRYNAELEL